MTLVSASELGALRAVAESGMNTPAKVYRRATVTDENGKHSTWAFQSNIMGWLFSEPSPVITLNASEQALVNTYRWFCPVGTDILSGDKLVIMSAEYTVSDTNTESTYLPLLRCSLRRAE